MQIRPVDVFPLTARQSLLGIYIFKVDNKNTRIRYEARDAFPAGKIRKEGSKRYLKFGLNHILVTLRWDDGRSSGHENVCRWFLNRCKSLLGPSKLINCVFLGKCSKWNLNFQNWSKSLCLGVSKPTKRLAVQSTAYALRD